MLTTATTFTLPAKLADMPEPSRVWVYKADRPLKADEVNKIIQEGQIFADGWQAHGQQLSAAVDVLLDRFVIIMVDEQVSDVSGCSIDTSVHFIKALEDKLDLKLTDRMVIWYEDEGEIRKCRTSKFKEKANNGVVNGDTIVYNDLVNTKADLRSKFRVPAKDSWHSSLL